MSDTLEDCPFTFEHFEPPVDLIRHFNSFYVLKFAPRRVEELVPAFTPQLLISSGPSGEIDFGSGLIESYRPATMIGQMASAHPIAMDGPSTIYGAAFTPYGWAAMTGLPIIQADGRHIHPVEGLGEEAGNAAIALGKKIGALSQDEALEEITALLRKWARPLPEGHGQLIATTYAWLHGSFNPDLDDLYKQLSYSERQVQRLVKRFFGFAPARLNRQNRALRAAALLADPNTDQETRNRVLDGYYDQAHLIREVRHFTGRTPRLLASGELTFASATLNIEGQIPDEG